MKLWPHKYYRGLTRKKALERKKEINTFKKMDWKNPKAYIGFKTDILKTRKSPYTAQWDKLFPHAKSLKERSKVTGVPLRFLKTVYNRGMAAWRTGHRPGATQQQWSYPRVSSFLLCGKTHYTADADQVRLARKTKGKKWFTRCNNH